jgi:hypothetical protein
MITESMNEREFVEEAEKVGKDNRHRMQQENRIRQDRTGHSRSGRGRKGAEQDRT